MSGVRLTAFRVSLLSTLSVVLLYVWASQFTLLRNLEAKALDLRFHLRGMQQPEAPVILVVIDDRSIAELGRWPWSRRRFAEIVQRLHEAGAKVVAFDLLFTEAETAIEQTLLGRVRQALEAFDGPLQARRTRSLRAPRATDGREQRCGCRVRIGHARSRQRCAAVCHDRGPHLRSTPASPTNAPSTDHPSRLSHPAESRR